MPEIHEMMPAFYQELIKEAVPGAITSLGRGLIQSPRLGGAGAGMGVGSLVGAGVGGAVQGTSAYQQARESGAGRGQAAMHALSGGASGAATGALVGAGAGAVAGGIRPGMMSNLPGRGGAIGASARFGQRQLHGLTGWTPAAGLQSIRGGAYQANRNVVSAQEAIAKATPGNAAKQHKKLQQAQRAQASAQKAEDMGITSIPGYAKSLANRPMDTIRAGVKEKWDSSGPVGRGLVFGFPAVTIGGELVRPSKPGEDGRIQRASRNIGDIAYAMAPLPFTSELALGSALSASGGQVGKLFSRKQKARPNAHIPAPPQIDPAGGDAVAGESIVTDRAMGGGSGL
jgi:hypothetical protein